MVPPPMGILVRARTGFRIASSESRIRCDSCRWSTRSSRRAVDPDAASVGSADVSLRRPGNRAPAEIPEAELADLAACLATVHADWDRTAIKGEVARLIGIGRYTDAADQLLAWAIG